MKEERETDLHIEVLEVELASFDCQSTYNPFYC